MRSTPTLRHLHFHVPIYDNLPQIPSFTLLQRIMLSFLHPFNAASVCTVNNNKRGIPSFNSISFYSRGKILNGRVSIYNIVLLDIYLFGIMINKFDIDDLMVFIRNIILTKLIRLVDLFQFR